MSPEEHSEAVVHLQKLLGKELETVQKLVELLRPFSERVTNAADELVVENTAEPEHFIKAYYGVQKYGKT